MTNIRNYIETHILPPLKQYPTRIQDTMLEIIADRLEQLYEYAWRFPGIVTPDKSRLDILKAIADQFLFTVRDEADIQEQIDILDRILYVYNRRGSIDTIENMWKYYGGDLPKDVKVIIPSYNLFRYSISALSGTHAFVKGKTADSDAGRVDRTVNTSGVYEIKLINNTYPIPDLKEFLLKELVAAGNEIYFTNTVHMQVDKNDMNTHPYQYKVQYHNFFQLQLEVLKSSMSGLTLSGYSHQSLSNKDDLSSWSGGGSILLELTHLIDLGNVPINTYLPYDILRYIIASLQDVVYTTKVNTYLYKYITNFLYCTPEDSSLSITRHLYGSQGELVDNYHGYFIIGKTLLDTEIV